MKNTLKALSITFLFSATTANAKLLPLTINGVAGTPAYYDTVLKITWLADWNLARTNQFGLPLSTRAAETVDGIVSATGKMSWNTANSWIAGMNQANYLGANNWRLPTMQDSGIAGCGSNNSDFKTTNATDCGVNVLSTTPNDGSVATTVYSEFASVVYDTLENNYQSNQSGGLISNANSGFHNSGSFTNILNSGLDFYWFNVEDVSNTNKAWTFYPHFGSQRTEVKSGLGLVVAVADGNIAVPEPNSLYLFCIGLLTLVFARKRHF